jgi:protein SCO1/2
MNIHSFLRFIFSSLIAAALLPTVSCSAIGPSFKGEVVEPATAAPQIDMPDQNGAPFELRSLEGDVAMVFFGFTNCVDECPLTMAHLTQARQLLGDRADQVHVVLVSTDPVRDTPDIMRDYLDKFDPAYVGITGAQEQLSKLWSDYGVTVLDGGETHSSFTYVVDQKGNLRLHFDPETSPEDIASDLKTLLNSQ